VAIPTSTTTWTWFETDLAVDVEDTSAEDGLRAAAWDDVAAQFRRTAGAATVFCAALCKWEPAA
jgi:hypothetical protein